MRLRLVPLILIILTTCTHGGTKGPAVLVASVVEDYDLGFFGGFSGLELGPDGREITLLMDSGLLIHGLLHRDPEGRPTGLRRWVLVPITAPETVELTWRGLDTEGLAIGPDGMFVSLERVHMVWRVSDAGEALEVLPRHADFEALQDNSSFEALAVDAEGRLYTLPERSGEWGRPFPVWRYDGVGWTRVFDLPRRGRFLAVGADIGPDGRFYLLERRLFLPFGFATRVRRFTIEGDSVRDEETLLETPLGMHDNLEGLAVWQDATGGIRLTMVSDDNRSRFQETQIVEYVLPPELDAAAQGR